MKYLLIFLSFICFLPAIAHADAPPVPPSKKQTLNALEKKLGNEKQEKQKLAHQAEKIEGALNNTKKRLVRVAKSIQKNEKTLQILGERIGKLEREQTVIQDNLQKDRLSISRLILALERIRRVPPEAMLAKPDAPLKAAQSAMLMRDIIPALNLKAGKLKTNLKNLEDISIDLKAKREKTINTSRTLNQEHAKLSDLLNKRQRLFSSTHKNLKAQERDIKRISAQAHNLQDLVKKLEADKKRKKNLQQSRKSTKTARSTPLPSPGNAQLPISGIIRVSYSEPDAFGAPSKGMSIEGLGGALVVAPMGGIVRFSGEFKNYGNMVILEHKNGYHSLIAGLEKIDTVVGDSVSAGEPLGLLHYATNGQKPALYYELRFKGKPVNPARKLAGLG